MPGKRTDDQVASQHSPNYLESARAAIDSLENSTKPYLLRLFNLAFVEFCF